MLDGWYCRSIANAQQAAGASSGGARMPGQVAPPNQMQLGPPLEQQRRDYSSDSSSSDQEPEVNYRTHYIALKRKLKYLIYENECFQDALRSSQRRLLKVSRDRTFLLDRLLQYEHPDSSSESENTETSDDEPQSKRKKAEPNPSQQTTPVLSSSSKTSGTAKRKRPPAPKKAPQNSQAPNQPPSQHQPLPKPPPAGFGLASAGDGHMTPEEVERHLQSRQSYMPELLPERAPPTVPTEMFSNDPSLDSESNDILENSPNVDEWIE